MTMESPRMESTEEERFKPGDRVKFIKDGREGIIVEENKQSLLPEGIVEVKFTDETVEGVQLSDLEKTEETKNVEEE